MGTKDQTQVVYIGEDKAIIYCVVMILFKVFFHFEMISSTSVRSGPLTSWIENFQKLYQSQVSLTSWISVRLLTVTRK